MLTWGVFAIAMGFVSGDTSFFVTRFLLGVAEAGFFPGVIYYLTLWFPAGYRGRIFGLFLIISPLNNTIAAPLGGLILKYFDGAMGYPGWRWLFIVEGLPTLLMAVPLPQARHGPPRPGPRGSPMQRRRICGTGFNARRSRCTETRHLSLWQTLANPKVLMFSVVCTRASPPACLRPEHSGCRSSSRGWG